MKKIVALLWRRCGDADLRALLGRGGGHNVIAFGSPEMWAQHFGVEINPESQGGTRFVVEAEPSGAGSFQLPTYLHEGRNEVRVKVPPILEANACPAAVAQANAAVLDPDGGNKSDELVVFLIRTLDEQYHLRACLESALIAPVNHWLSNNGTGGRTFEGVVLGIMEQKIWNTLIRHKNVLLYGPPGTGKTWSMLQIRTAFERGLDEIWFKPTDLVNPFQSIPSTSLPQHRKTEFVTFHQSLTYESFIVGLRPIPNEDGSGGGVSFLPKNGIFLDLAEHALQDDSAALLLIDELNRGNVADIFGELITVLEDDKRLSPSGELRDTTVTVTLPLKPERLDQKFRMPNAFYLLASMNSLDRSVAPLDSALRRRFRLINMRPNYRFAHEFLLGGRAGVMLENPNDPSPDECKTIALAFWRRINDGIRGVLGPEFQIGHSYVLSVSDYTSLVDVLAESILPQVYELFRDRPRDLLELLGDRLVTLPEGINENGLGVVDIIPAELIDIRELNQEELMRSLFEVAYGRPWTEPEGEESSDTELET